MLKPPQTAVLGSINDGVALGALFLANFTIIFFPVLFIIRTFEIPDAIRCQIRKDLCNQIKRILFMQKPDLESDLQKPSLVYPFMMLCMSLCSLTVLLILVFQISDYGFVFAVKYVYGYMFVYSGVVCQ